MKILILGGDGFCGWPTALRLSKSGYEITIIDNLSRRKIDKELKSNSITDIASIEDRISTAKQYGMDIKFLNIDITDYNALYHNVKTIKPDAIIHFAEQRAAPYSMISNKERRYTVDNNIINTHNILNSIVDIDKNIHLVHLGTMGVYGYSKDFGDIPEGYLNVKINSTQKDVDILYPTNPGSVYHMTKSIDQLLFQFYNKNWNLKITDLHQGIVWGTQTEETSLDKKLVNRFDYDGIYGTVLNRFISQVATGNDLTVYGTGGQKRAFIHIQDTAKCIELAVNNPPSDTNKVRIFNQVSEVKSVKELAETLTKENGSISYVDNPRKELKENDLSVKNDGLKSLGFKPITLSESLINDVKFIAKEMKKNLKKENILTSPRW
jgi:UDP-sulfoquinovose synthase